jgi:uncharacterized protein
MMESNGSRHRSCLHLILLISTLMIDKELLEILVCPDCKVPVTPTPKEDGLFCAQCRRLYPIVDDIPVMLIDKAKRME